MDPMVKAMLWGAARHLVAIAGTYGVVVSDSQVQTILSGAATAFSIGSSLYQKYKVNRKIAKAAATGLP